MFDLLAIISVLSLLGFIVILTNIGKRRELLSSELARKIIHIAMGCVCMSFPWLIDNPLSIQILGGLAIIGIATLKMSPLKNTLGVSLFSVQRLSLGELFFPLAVAWLFSIGHESPLYYLIALLHLSFADAFGALVGTRYGKRHYSTTAGKKTIEGSLTFFAIAFACTLLPLLIASDLATTHILLISIMLALLTSLLEGAAGHGMDNLFIPIAAFLVLDYYAEQSEHSLIVRCIVLLSIIMLLICSRKIHTFNGGGLIGCTLFGFVCFSFGGLACLLSALLLFARHLWISQRYQLYQSTTHCLMVVFSAVLTPLLWLTAIRSEMISEQVGQPIVILSIASTASMLYGGTIGYLQQSPRKLFFAPLVFVLVSSPLFLVSSFSYFFLAIMLSAVILALLLFKARNFLGEGPYWSSLTCLSLAQSILLYLTIP